MDHRGDGEAAAAAAESMTPPPPNFIVGIGGSAGGLPAYVSFLEALSIHTGMAFVIVYHFPPTAKSQLANILSKHTKMPVLDVSTAMHIQADHVYVCPPNSDIFIEGNTFRVATPRVKGNTQVDVLFSSLALAMGHRAIGIIFSGYCGDGAEGCRVIKAKGGTNFAQDQSAEVSSMPQSAQQTGCVDFVLSPEKIAERLLKLAKGDVL